MQLTFDIPKKDLADFGKETIEQEIHRMLKWLRIKKSFNKISQNLKEVDKQSYYRELENIRESSWNEYKDKFELWK